MKILIGSDPEVFVKKDGKFVSAYGLVEGDKVHPQRVERGAVQVDGMALEFNTDPAESCEEFVTNVFHVMKQLGDMVPEYELSCSPVAEFGKEYIAAQPDKAKELGCDPDWNAWTGEINTKPDEDLPFRTGAGHVHIGWTEGADVDDPVHRRACETLVKQLDLYLGVPSVLYDNSVDRRAMYGAAGAYRPKSYGVEYRTLSNKWLENADLVKWVYNNTLQAVENMLSGNRLNVSGMADVVENAINTSNVEEVEKLISLFNIPKAPEA